MKLVLCQAGTLRRRPHVDPGDAEASRRRVRALQKKLREIEKLKVSRTCWEGCFSICGLMMILVHDAIFFRYSNSLKMFPIFSLGTGSRKMNPC